MLTFYAKFFKVFKVSPYRNPSKNSSLSPPIPPFRFFVSVVLTQWSGLVSRTVKVFQLVPRSLGDV